MNSRSRLAAVIVAAVVVMAIGAGLFLRSTTPNVAGPASASPLVTSSAGPRSGSQSASALALPTGLIVFEHFGGQIDGTTPHPEASWQRLWVVKTDGTGVHELFPTRAGNQAQMAWSPDGQHLVFWDAPAPGQERLIQTAPSGSSPRVLDTGCRRPTCAEDDAPAFSRDGQQLALVRIFQNPKDIAKAAGSELVVWDVATGQTREIGSTKVSFTANKAWDAAPRWSPDGSQIVFYRWQFGAKEQVTSSDIFIVGADGRNLRRLTPDGFEAGDPDWSPDGSRIVFNSDPANVYLEGGVQGKGANIYAIRPDGTDLQQLTRDGYSYSPTWLADGRILFMRGPLVRAYVASDFWIMDGDGARAVKITNFQGGDGSCCSFYAALRPTP